MREAPRGQTVKKQISIDLVHNSPMTAASVTITRRLALRVFAVALVAAGCTSVTPPPSIGPTPTPVQTLAPTAASTGNATAPATAVPEQSSAAPTPTPTSSGSLSPVPSCMCTQAPAPSLDPAVAAQIDTVVAQVPPIRQLQATKAVPYRLISRDDFTSYLVAHSNDDTTPDWRAAEERFLKRFGLLPADADLNALLLQLYGAEVAAYYDPTDGTFYIIDRGVPFGPVDKLTTSHEYTHALQDQHFDLEGNRIKDQVQGDEILSQLAVIEGDATLTSQQWMAADMTAPEQLQLVTDAAQQAANDPLASMPLILRRQLEFPYVEGFMFTKDVWGLGGYDAVNQAIQTPPGSTEQILHSDKYYSQEAPVAVAPTDLTSALGSGWANVYQQTMGELNIQVLATGGEKPPLDLPGLPAQWPHQEVAAGWGGDKLNMYENGDQWLVDWQTAWDTQADADEFSARMTDLTSSFQGSLRLIPGAQTVRVVLASDPNLFLNLPSG
jgi:hypothetical protein